MELEVALKQVNSLEKDLEDSTWGEGAIKINKTVEFLANLIFKCKIVALALCFYSKSPIFEGPIFERCTVLMNEYDTKNRQHVLLRRDPFIV